MVEQANAVYDDYMAFMAKISPGFSAEGTGNVTQSDVEAIELVLHILANELQGIVQGEDTMANWSHEESQEARGVLGSRLRDYLSWSPQNRYKGM
jgi:hypothetical protein